MENENSNKINFILTLSDRLISSIFDIFTRLMYKLFELTYRPALNNLGRQ